MTRTASLISTILFGSIAALGSSSALAAGITTKPPANFKKASSLAKLPDFIPGLGTLYVDPKTLPVGPWLGYNHKGRLVDIVYMVPLSDLDGKKSFTDLGTLARGLEINHTDIEYNPGHPGVEEPHYHIVEWLISKKAQEQEMK